MKLSGPDCPQSTRILFASFHFVCINQSSCSAHHQTRSIPGEVKPIGFQSKPHSPIFTSKKIFLIPIWLLLFTYLPHIQREQELSYLGSCKYQLPFVAIILLCLNVCLAIYLLLDYTQLDSKTYFFSSLVNPSLM